MTIEVSGLRDWGVGIGALALGFGVKGLGLRDGGLGFT